MSHQYRGIGKVQSQRGGMDILRTVEILLETKTIAEIKQVKFRATFFGPSCIRRAENLYR
jgi:hypothetical protein